jgi:hypothetical protein
LELLTDLYTLFTDHTGGVKNLCTDLSATWGDTQAEKEYFYREERCFKFTASKTKQLHIVPLSDQAFDLIESIIDLHPYSEYILWVGMVKPVFLTIHQFSLETLGLWW